MADRDGPDFKAAARHHDELGERQVETLALIAEGLSNSEIAASLGLTLDETKWNISALISKLGLGNRDEAAAYYRWRERPGRKVVRNAGVLAAGMFAVLVMTLLAVALWPGGESGTPGAFYLELTFEFDNSFAVEVDTTADAETDDEERILRVLLKQWFEPPNLWRVEMDSISGPSIGGPLVMVFDGTGLTYYKVDDSAYSVLDDSPRPGWEGLPWLPMPVAVGRVPGADADEFLEVIASDGGQTVLRREDSLDGRAVVLIEQEHANQCLGQSGPRDRNFTDCTLIRRYWLDEERMIVLRAESWQDGEYRLYRGEVIEFRNNVVHDPALFKFTPPEGAVEDTDPFE